MGISDDIVPRRVHNNHGLNSADLFNVQIAQRDSKEKDNKQNEIAEVEDENQDEKSIESKKKIEQLKNDFFKQPLGKTPSEAPPIPKPKKKRVKFNKIYRFLTISLILVVACLVAWQYWYQKNKSGESTKKVTVNTNSNLKLEEYSSDIVPQDYTTGTNANININGNTNSASVAAANTNQSAAIAKSAIKINLLNGNGIKNSAALIKKTLETAGFTIQAVGNAKTFSYPKTEIYYNTGKLDAANLVKSALTGRVTEIVESPDLTVKYDIVIVIGKQ